jgi:serpin B
MLATILLAIYGCEKDNPAPNLSPKNISLTAKAPQVIASSSEFGIELFTKTASESNQNLMLSPLSASTALTMLLNGCGGETYNQLKETLKYPDDMTISEINDAYKSLVKQLLAADSKVSLTLANAIFYHQDFSVKPTYINAMSTNFSAHIKGLDFSNPSALTTINKWASDNTNGKIPVVLNEISAAAVMFLMNALYFKGNWSYKFDKSQTSNRTFYLDNGTTVNTPTMTGDVGVKFVIKNNLIALELPYGRTNFTMVVIMPNSNFTGFIPTFNYAEWLSITSYIDDIEDYSKSIVYMPRFKFSYEKYLTDQLKSMGMIDAFDPISANLTGISDASIFVSFVKQNTFVEVNEEGTEAAAVTTIGFEYTSGPSQLVVSIDKPFVFAIRERTTNTLMFIGQITNPL